MVCQHYQVQCQILAPCCGKFYDCRNCHDAMECHALDRYSIQSMRCNLCSLVQPKCLSCIQCHASLAEYFCDLCNLWCEAMIYHCPGCNVCYKTPLGTRFHCNSCGLCFEGDQETHQCGQKHIAKGDECCVCMDPLYYQTRQAVFSRCGHALHKDCMDSMLQQNQFQCPLCKKTMTDMDWGLYRKAIRSIVLPDLSTNDQSQRVTIHCNDCLEDTEVDFHPIGMECPHCSSFNTYRA